MIKNIIFDFGDIFINLDKQAPIKAFTELGLTFRPEIENINNKYEVGAISSQEFVASYKDCLLYTSPSPRDGATSRMPSSA